MASVDQSASINPIVRKIYVLKQLIIFYSEFELDY